MPKKHFNFKAAIVFVAAVVILAVTAWGLRKWQRNRMAYASLQQGLQAYENYEWDDASTQLGRYLGVDKSDTQILLKYAKAHLNIRPLKQNNIQQAIGSYRGVIRADKDHKEALEKLVGLYLQLNIPAEAQLIAERFLQTHQDPQISTMLAVAMVKQRKIDQAFTLLQTITEKYPDQISAWEVMAMLAESYPQDSPVTAEYCFEKCLSDNPLSAVAYITRARFHLNRNQLSQGIADLAKAQKLGPLEPAVAISLAEVFAQIGDFDKARAQLIEAKKQEPANQMLWQVWADMALKAGSKEEMAQVADSAIAQLRSQPWDFMPMAAELFIQAGQLDKASDYLKKLKRRDVAVVETAFLEGLLAQARKQDHNAIRAWTNAQQLGDTSARNRLALAKAYFRSGNSLSTVLELQKLILQQPDHLEAHIELAGVWAQTGNWIQAAEQARLAIEIAPNNFKAAQLYARIQMQLIVHNIGDIGQNSKRIGPLLDKLETSRPDDMTVKLLRLRFELAGGRLTEVEKLLAKIKPQIYEQIEFALIEVDLLIAADKTDEAISRLYAATKQFPNKIRLTTYLADMLDKKHRRSDCEKVLRDAIDRLKNPAGKRKAGLMLAVLYNQWQQRDKSILLLEELSSQLAYDIPIRRQLIENKIFEKDLAYAQRVVGQIKTIEGKSGWQWRYEQAMVWFHQEDFNSKYPRIIGLLKENLEVNPADQKSRLLLARSYEKAGELQLAVTTYRQALNRSPDDLRIIVAVVRAMYGAKQYVQAEEILKTAVDKKLTHPQISKLQLQSHLRRGRFASAEIILEEMMSADPDNQTIILPLAMIKMRQDKLDSARELLEQAIAGKAMSAAVGSALVELNLREKNNAQALSLCDEMVKTFDNAFAYLTRAKTYAALGQNEKAKANFQKAAAIEPSNTQVWLSSSRFNLQIRKAAVAIEDGKKALALDPENLGIQKYIMGLLLSSSRSKNRRLGRELLEKALTSNPDDMELRLQKAGVLSKKATSSTLRQADRILRKITEQRPELSMAWAMLADTALMRDQSEQAIDVILQGLAYSPADKTLQLLKARAEAARLPKLAIPTLRALYESEPNDSDIALELANVYIKTGDYNQCVAVLQSLLDNCPAPERTRIATLLAVALYRAGDKAQAKQRFDLLYRAEPNEPGIFLAEAKVLADDRDWDRLKNKIDNRLEQNPDDLDAMASVADILIKIRDYHTQEIAEDVLRKVLNRDANNLQAMNLLALVLQTTGRAEESAQLYRKIIHQSPETMTAVNNLAWLLCEQQGKYQQALELAEKGLRKAPDYIDMIDTRGVIYYRLGEFHKAVEDFNRCIELYRRNSSVQALCYFHLARAQAKMGRDIEAIENLQKVLEIHSKGNSLSQAELTQTRLLLKQLLEKTDYVSLSTK